MSQHHDKKTIAIIGPTASGKSDAAILIARQSGGAIIGADSRQVYRHADLGSGKEPGALCDLRTHTHCAHTLPKKLRVALARTPYLWHPYISAGVAHYMIDIVSPRTSYGAAQFVARAQKVRTALWRRNILPIVCGGTHFWVQSLVENAHFPHVPPNPHLRRELRAMTTADLFTRLMHLDERRARAIAAKNERNNRHRLMRAVEIAVALGAVPTAPKSTPPSPRDTLIIAIAPDMDTLRRKIITRLDERLSAGLLDEIRALHDVHGVSYARMERWGLEYAWGARVLRGHVSFATARDALARDILRFAKRQLTWIRRWERAGARIHRIRDARNVTAPVAAFLHAET